MSHHTCSVEMCTACSSEKGGMGRTLGKLRGNKRLWAKF